METTRIALVTGTNRGIGFAVSKELLKKGITVIMTCRNEMDGHQAVKKLSKYGNAVFHQLDVADTDSMVQCFYFVKQEFGKLD